MLDPQWSNAPDWLAQGGDDAARALDSAALSRLGKTVADLGRIHRATGSLAGTLDLLRYVGRRRTVRSQGPAPGVGADGDAVVHRGGEERLESVLGLTTNPTTTTQVLPQQHRSAGWPGGRGQLPTRGSHGSGRAPFGQRRAAAGRLRLRRRPARRKELEDSPRQAQGPTRGLGDLQGKPEGFHPRHFRVRTGADRIARASRAAEGGSFPALRCRGQTSHQTPSSCWTTLAKTSANRPVSNEWMGISRRGASAAAMGLRSATEACPGAWRIR